MIKTGAISWHLLALLSEEVEVEIHCPKSSQGREKQITYDNFMWYLPILNALHPHKDNSVFGFLEYRSKNVPRVICLSICWDDQVHECEVFPWYNQTHFRIKGTSTTKGINKSKSYSVLRINQMSKLIWLLYCFRSQHSVCVCVERNCVRNC